MGRRYYSPEEFIRDFLKRGFTREQVLGRARKKDKGFYRLVEEILNHTTLIEKIQGEVDSHLQASIDFEHFSYSSKTLLNGEKAPKKEKKDNGRSDLPVHTDIHWDDLEAPLPNFSHSKAAFSQKGKSKKRKKSNIDSEQQLSLFDEKKEKTEEANKQKAAVEFAQEFPFKVISTEKLKPKSQVETHIMELHESDEDSSESSVMLPTIENRELANISDKDKNELVRVIEQKEFLLKEMNRNLAIKEEKIHCLRTISEKTKDELNKEKVFWKNKAMQYKVGFMVAAVIFSSTIFLLKALQTSPVGNYSIESNSSYQLVETSLENNPLESIEILPPQEDDEFEVIAQSDSTHETREDASSRDIILSDSAGGNLHDMNIRAPERVMHVVKNGDNWWKIAVKYLGSDKGHHYKKIIKYNQFSKETLIPGQKIKIPTLAELELE